MTSLHDATTLPEFLAAFQAIYHPRFKQPQMAALYGVSERTYRDWLKDAKKPGAEHIRTIAEVTKQSPSRIRLLSEGADPEFLALAFAREQTEDSVTRGVRRIEDLVRDANRSLPAAIAATGEWEVVSVPRHRSVTVKSGEVSVYWGDYVGVRPSRTNKVNATDSGPNPLAGHVIKSFREVLKATAAMPEDDESTREGLMRYHPNVGTWFKVNHFTMRPPGPEPTRLGPVRRVHVLGTHFGGQDQAGALLADALGWGLVNTSFTAARFFERRLAVDKSSRRLAQEAHDAGGLTVARTVIARPEFNDHVLALGNPNVLPEVAALVADPARKDELVVLCLPGEGLADYTERQTVSRPDEVKAAEMQAQAEQAHELLTPRIEDGSALVLTMRPAASEADFFPSYAAHFRAIYRWLMERAYAPLPEDATYRALVDG